ncbi:hypothetical protein EDD16DRAFT_1728192 [Pisolithus croceorrhizus]|nr:hypothetical protein EDD16DRAFT_1728192 [Pisolithus croceorrhizus]
MPKRIPTPPPGDDEPKYLTVVHPYAREGYCNMEFQQDRKDFAFWVACCIDKNAFFAVFHKPSARDMVIIEVNRDYPHFDRLLGEHRWSEFLRKPSPEEESRVTQIFYCTYHTGRIVEKNGWKRIFVEDAWFDGWSPKNSLIVYPYPAPHFCDVPREDATNHPLCRPLPGLAGPAPPEVIVAPKPIVGSAAWTNSKGKKTASAWNTTPAKGLTKQGVPKPAVPPTNINTKQPASTQSRNASVPAVGGGPLVVKAANVWRTDVGHSVNPPAVVPVNWECSPGSSRRSTPERQQSGTSISSTSVDQPPPRPPAKANTRNAVPPPGPVVSGGWDDCGKTTRSASTPGGAPLVPDRSTSWSNANSSSTGSSSSVSTPDTEPGCNDVCEDPRMIHVQMREGFEEEFHGMGIREGGIYSDEDEDLAELDAVAPGSWNIATDTWGVVDAQATSGWGDAPGSQRGAENQLEKEVCSVHGVICKKGICAVQGKKKAAAKRMEKREEAIKKQQENRGKKGKGPAKSRDAGPTATTNNQNNPYRGPGAPVKKNWRGAPRVIVSPDTLEQREAAAPPVENVNGWGNNDDDGAANGSDEPTSESTEVASDVASNDGWNISEASYDPWAPSQPAKKGMSWAEEMEAASAAGSDGEGRSGTHARRRQGKGRGKR